MRDQSENWTPLSRRIGTRHRHAYGKLTAISARAAASALCFLGPKECDINFVGEMEAKRRLRSNGTKGGPKWKAAAASADSRFREVRTIRGSDFCFDSARAGKRNVKLFFLSYWGVFETGQALIKEDLLAS